MARYTQTNISTIAGVNSELSLIETAMVSLLDRDGDIPNQLEADIDLNSNDLLNASTINTSTLIINGVEATTSLAGLFTTMPSGATQVAAGAVEGELWKTASHATLPDNVVLIGI